MDERLLDRVAEILEADPEVYVPVKKLYHILHSEGRASFSMEDFYQQLIADPRFEFIRGVDGALEAGHSAFDPMLEQELEEQGVFGGLRVKLVKREMSAEDALEGLTRSLQQLSQALQGAWESRPEGDPVTEAMLRDAMDMTRQLEQDVEEINRPQEGRSEEENA